MKILVRCLTQLLAALLWAAPGYAQDGPQGDVPEEGRGAMAEIAAHGVQGTVSAVSGDTILVKTEDGQSYKIETGVNTRLRRQRDPIKLTDIHVGDTVAAFGDKDEKARTLGAVAVMIFDRQQYEKARANFGKTWTAGAVQSIEETRITIKRPDNAMQTIVVDENTSFRKRRDSITLADIKVGDNVTARGSLQGTNFLAATLSVGGPGGGGFHGPHPGSTANEPGNASAPPNR